MRYIHEVGEWIHYKEVILDRNLLLFPNHVWPISTNQIAAFFLMASVLFLWFILSCCRLNCTPCPLMLKPWLPGPQTVLVFRNREFKGVMKLKWCQSLGWALIPSDWSPYKKRLGYRKRDTRDVRQESPHEDTVWAWPPASQGVTPQEKPNLPAPRSWAFSPQNCE